MWMAHLWAQGAQAAGGLGRSWIRLGPASPQPWEGFRSGWLKGILVLAACEHTVEGPSSGLPSTIMAFAGGRGQSTEPT